MRISDWSSDVCSSDLAVDRPRWRRAGNVRQRRQQIDVGDGADAGIGTRFQPGGPGNRGGHAHAARSEEHTSELQSLMRISYAVFCLKKKKNTIYKQQKLQTQSRTNNHHNTS